jgi:hypothetical protein
MNKLNPAEERINQYLAAVASHLSSLSEDEKEEILNSVRAHIDNELQIRSQDQPTLEDVEEVLLDMDPPASYMGSTSPLSADKSPDRRISRLAIIGVLLLPVLFIILIFVTLNSSTIFTSPSNLQILLRFTILLTAVITSFASIALGFTSISQIRNSNGSIYGLPLAVFVSLFYPIIVLDVILIIIGWTLLGDVEGWGFLPVIWLFFVFAIDYLIVRSTWRAANR